MPEWNFLLLTFTLPFFHDEYHEHLNLEVLLLKPNALHSPQAQRLPSVSHLGNFNKEQDVYSEHATAPS